MHTCGHTRFQHSSLNCVTHICAFKATIAGQPLKHPDCWVPPIRCFTGNLIDARVGKVKACDLRHAHFGAGNKHHSALWNLLPNKHAETCKGSLSRGVGFFFPLSLPCCCNCWQHIASWRIVCMCGFKTCAPALPFFLRRSGTVCTIPLGGKERVECPMGGKKSHTQNYQTLAAEKCAGSNDAYSDAGCTPGAHPTAWPGLLTCTSVRWWANPQFTSCGSLQPSLLHSSRGFVSIVSTYYTLDEQYSNFIILYSKYSLYFYKIRILMKRFLPY